MRTFFKHIVGLAGLFFTAEVLAAVNIAVIMPLSGDKAVAGNEIVSGVRTAVDELNTEGGLNGEKINLIIIEDECNDSLAVSSAQMMALNTNQEYKPQVVIGPYCDNQFNKVTSTLAGAEIFQIIPTPVDDDYAEQKQAGLIKMVGYKEQQASDFFHYYKENFEWLPVALIFDNNNADIAQDVQKIFTQNNKSDNLTLYNFEEYNFDYDKIADKALAHNTKMAFILGASSHVGRMAKELKSNKRSYKIFVNKYQVVPEFENIMGDLIEGCYFMGLPSLKDSPEFTETLVKLRLLGIEPEGLAVYGYSAVNLWAELARESGSFDYSSLVKTLQNTHFDSGWGQQSFVNGTPEKSLNYGIFQYHNGEYAQVY